MPLAIVMLVPLVWIVMTSLETLAQTHHFPPILWPGSFQWENYPRAFTQRAVRPLVLEHDGGDDRRGRLATCVLCSLAAYAFARIGSSARVAYFFLLATLMVPLQVVLIPTFLIVKQLHLIEPPRRADRAEPRERVRHLHAHAVLPDAADRAGGGRADRRRLAG